MTYYINLNIICLFLGDRKRQKKPTDGNQSEPRKCSEMRTDQEQVRIILLENKKRLFTMGVFPIRLLS